MEKEDAIAERNGSQGTNRKVFSGLTRAAIWLGGSAFLGSLALVLWNRRALISMREAGSATEEPVRLADDDIY